MIVQLSKAWTTESVANAVGGKLYGAPDALLTALTTDSREVTAGAIFVAIRGENSDGHLYIEKAASMGAACVICDRLPDKLPICPLIHTEDSVKAMGLFAKAYKQQIDPLTVAITGSIGKTTTKEFVAAVLSQHYTTLKTPGNFNNHLGMPLTMLSLNETHNAVVLEMGMSAKGEIEYLSKLGNPKIAVITAIGTSHIEHLGSREGIRDAKMEITLGMEQGGALILDGDEPLLANVPGAYYVSLKNPNADFYISNIEQSENGSAFDLKVGREVYESLLIPVIGSHNVKDAAYAFAVGSLAGMGEYEIRRGLRDFRQTGMRQNLYQQNGMWIIEDCYNAAPESMQASLKVLTSVADTKAGRKIAVLGEMRELGNYSEEGHYIVGKAVADEHCDLLFTFGKDAKIIAQGALDSGMPSDSIISVESLDAPEEVAAAIRSRTKAGDVLLFKASRAVKLERIIALLK